eukprot:1151390-Pelagomonas_calceolata.AAC.1
MHCVRSCLEVKPECPTCRVSITRELDEHSRWLDFQILDEDLPVFDEACMHASRMLLSDEGLIAAWYCVGYFHQHGLQTFSARLRPGEMPASLAFCRTLHVIVGMLSWFLSVVSYHPLWVHMCNDSSSVPYHVSKHR